MTWAIAPPTVLLSTLESVESRKGWRIGCFDAPDADELFHAVGDECVAGSYRSIGIDDVLAILPPDLGEWVRAINDRQRTLAKAFGVPDPRLAPNEEHARVAARRLKDLVCTDDSKRRADEHGTDTMIVMPDTVGELLEQADRRMTLAEAHIELAVRLAHTCGRPPRWLSAQQNNAPATAAFFLISASSVSWVEAAAAHPQIRAVDVSIEAMGAFAAIEASKATGRPQVVIAGIGPGTLGMNWAIPAAKAQGASLLVLVPRTAPHLVGSVDIQEASYSEPLHMAGAALYDDVIAMEDPAEMPRIAIRLRHLFSRPQGAVVMLTAPTSLLNRKCPPLPDIDAVEISQPAPNAVVVARVAKLLSDLGGPAAFLLGSGCSPYRHLLGAVIKRWGAVHFTTPAATGLVPGSLGGIGNAAYGNVPERLRALDVRCVVILGTRLGTASGGGNSDLFPGGCQIVHVEIDPNVTAANAVATWNRPVLRVTADIGEFLAALERVAPDAPPGPLARTDVDLGITPSSNGTVWRDTKFTDRGAGRDVHREAHVNPQDAVNSVMRAAAQSAQEVAIFAESGSAMLYGTRALAALDAPGLYYQMSVHYGSMGHALGGAVGFCAATGKRAIVLTGDGSLHLLNPLPTALKHGCAITLVVLNDSRLGLPFHGSGRVGAFHAQATTPLEPWDFTRTGSERISGRRVSDLAALDATLAEALSMDGGCFVVDVAIDPAVVPPLNEREDSVAALFRNDPKPSRALPIAMSLWRGDH